MGEYAQSSSSPSLPDDQTLLRAAERIRAARHLTAFTGAGISVESGIPPFRGPGGLWNRYDPGFLDISFFLRHPESSWKLIKEIFYDFFGTARPNAAHYLLATMEEAGLLQAVITQNIDGLHQAAGSRTVLEFHGTSARLRCQGCGALVPSREVDLQRLPPRCASCGGLLRPDFVFFGEPIPEEVNARSLQEAREADLLLVIGTTGEIMPASLIPRLAKERGAAIMEINTTESSYTGEITDLFLQGPASKVARRLAELLELSLPADRSTNTEEGKP